MTESLLVWHYEAYGDSWASCGECCKLMAEQNYKALAERSTEIFKAKHGRDPEQLATLLEDILVSTFAHA